MMRRIIISALTVLLLSATVSAQRLPNGKAYLSKSFSLKHHIYFFPDHVPKVYADKIIFIGECDDGDYRGLDSLSKGREIKIKSIVEGQLFTKVSFTAHATDFEILLRSDSRKSFRNSFDLIFSEREIPYGISGDGVS